MSASVSAASSSSTFTFTSASSSSVLVLSHLHLTASSVLVSVFNWLAALSLTQQLLLILVLLFLAAVWRMRAPRLLYLPGPKRYFFFGNLFELLRNRDRRPDWSLENARKFGRTWSNCIPGNFPFISLVDPVNVEYILKKNFENYVKGPVFHETFVEFMGDGIFNADGALWKRQRKIASHMFSVDRLKVGMSRVFCDQGQYVTAKLEKLQDGQFIDMQMAFFNYTMDAFGEIGFGVKLRSFDSEDMPEFAAKFDLAQTLLEKRFLSPLWRWKRRLGLGHEPEFAASCAFLDKFALDVIASRRADPDMESRDDLLSLFMAAKDDEGQPFDNKYLRDVVLNFMIAGRDTTACALTWQFMLLAKNPEVEQKLIDEIDEVVGDQTPSFDVMKRLKYAEAVALETLRLYPSVPFDSRNAVQDDTLPDGTLVPAGAGVGYAPYVFGRLETLWGADAEQFKPERWLGDVPASQYLYTTFNAGPRLYLRKLTTSTHELTEKI